MVAKDLLLNLLDDAATVVSGFGEMSVYCPFHTGAQFAAELRALRERVNRQDESAMRSLIVIFAPTGAWDDGVGAPGIQLANRILAELDCIGHRAEPLAAAVTAATGQ